MVFMEINHETHEKHKSPEQPETFVNGEATELLEAHEEMESPGKILFKDEVYAIQGAVFEVYKVLGCGFLEAVYQECLEIELASRGIPFVSQKDLMLSYKGQPLVQRYRPDLICFDSIIVELKAATELANEHRAQLLNYLKATGMRLGLLVNFGHHPKAQIERFIR